MNKISIIIPIYNEEGNIFELNEEIINNLNNKIIYEIIYVNDASIDDSLKILNQLKSNFQNIRIINHDKNLGQSKSLLSGIQSANFNDIVTIDGDGQNNPKDILNLTNIYFLNQNLNLVGGIRINRKDSLIKIISSKIANKVRGFILKDNCKDTGCSLKIFNKSVFLSFPFFDGIHRFLPALFAGSGKKVFFIDVDHRHRSSGVSKYDTFGRLFKGIRDIIKVVIILKKIKRNRV